MSPLLPQRVHAPIAASRARSPEHPTVHPGGSVRGAMAGWALTALLCVPRAASADLSTAPTSDPASETAAAAHVAQAMVVAQLPREPSTDSPRGRAPLPDDELKTGARTLASRQLELRSQRWAWENDTGNEPPNWLDAAAIEHTRALRAELDDALETAIHRELPGQAASIRAHIAVLHPETRGVVLKRSKIDPYRVEVIPSKPTGILELAAIATVNHALADNTARGAYLPTRALELPLVDIRIEYATRPGRVPKEAEELPPPASLDRPRNVYANLSHMFAVALEQPAEGPAAFVVRNVDLRNGTRLPGGGRISIKPPPSK